MKQIKTNAMRILEREKIPYTLHTYDTGGPVDGVSVAHKTGRDAGQVFKTLVARGAGDAHYVFVIPVDRELNLKAAARAAGEKSVALVPLAQLTPLTGYVRGGCSPVGLKKPFPVYLDAGAAEWQTILVSGGRVGTQIEIAPADLMRAVDAQSAELTI